MNRFKTILAMLAFVLLAISCQKDDTPKVEYLDVTPNNISGNWKLVEWNGLPLSGGTYFYVQFTRKDREFTIWQNFDSMLSYPHQLTGEYNIQIDVEKGAIIEGQYDFDGGFWSYKYEINDLTADSMTWVAVEDESFTQKFIKVDSIPVKE